MLYPHSLFLAYLDSKGESLKDISKKVQDLGYPDFTKASLAELRAEFDSGGKPDYETAFRLAGIETNSTDWSGIPHLLADTHMRIRVNVFSIGRTDPEVISNYCRSRFVEISIRGIEMYLAMFFNMKIPREGFNAFIAGLKSRKEADIYDEAIHEDPQSVLYELGIMPPYDLEKSLSDMAYASYHKFMKSASVPGITNSNHALRWAKAMTDSAARLEKAKLNKDVSIKKEDMTIHYDSSELPTLENYHKNMYEILKKRGNEPPSSES